MKKLLPLGLASGALILASTIPARAQVEETSPIISPVIPDGFDRDRNVSVAQRPRPDYDPLGIPVASFNVYPRVDVGAGFSDNIYVTSSNTKSDAFAYVSPQVTARSDWAMHEVSIDASGQFRRFLDEPRRNETQWNLRSLARLDAGNTFSVTTELQLAKLFESPIVGGNTGNLAVLSRYLRGYGALRGEYRSGQFRVVGAVDRTSLAFSDIPLENNAYLDQSFRDRIITRLTGQAEYALSPSISVYGQLNLSNTDYSRLLIGGISNRDSDAIRALAGVNFDLAGLMRGTIGVGYVHRNYEAPRYKDVDGVSVEARLEYFLSELTTVGIGARRVVEDSAIGTQAAYFDNRATARIDHELLRNLILNAVTEISYEDYIGIDQSATAVRFAGGGRYLVSRNFNIEGTIGYTRRASSNSLILGQKFNEFRAQLGVVVRQ